MKDTTADSFKDMVVYLVDYRLSASPEDTDGELGSPASMILG
jgi:hypothetical protein